MRAGSPIAANSVHDPYAVPSLPDDAVHLWVVDVSHGAHAVTSALERARAARFRRPADGDRFLAARASLRRILAGYLECDPHTLSFSHGEWGKPAIHGTALSFNLSHSGALALVAVARGRQVGVDVERQREIADLDGIALRICTPRERRELEAVAPSARQGAFLALWTRKEALAKMTGEGMRVLARDAWLAEQDDCMLEQVLDLPGYAACVAAQGKDWRLVRCAPAARPSQDP